MSDETKSPQEEVENPQAETPEENTEETQAEAQEEQPKAEDDLTALKQEVGEAKDKYLRLYSDFENFRRRTAREKTELIQTAGEKVIREMLTVLDDFERAIKAQGEPAGGEEQSGMGLIHHKMLRILEQQGLKAIEVKAGDVFDVELHEAITQIPAPDESLKGKIVDEVEKGYTLNEKVIRFAKVVVGS